MAAGGLFLAGLCHRRQRRTVKTGTEKSPAFLVAGKGHLAAFAGAPHARRAALPRVEHPQPPSLPPGLMSCHPALVAGSPALSSGGCRNKCGMTILKFSV